MARRTVIRRKVTGFIEVGASSVFPDDVAQAAEAMQELADSLPTTIKLGDPEIKSVKAEEPDLPLEADASDEPSEAPPD